MVAGNEHNFTKTVNKKDIVNDNLMAKARAKRKFKERTPQQFRDRYTSQKIKNLRKFK